MPETVKISQKKKKQIIALVILIFVLIASIMYQILSRPDPPPPGAMRKVQCTNKQCNFKGIMRIVDMQKNKYYCPKCKSRVGFAYKCFDCDFEFAHIPGKITMDKVTNSMQVFHRRMNDQKCPNCHSISTAPLSTNSK